jgi:cell division protein FtsB
VPAERFAADTRKQFDSVVAKAEKAIAEREAELVKRDARRAKLEAEIASVGAGEESP